MVLFLGVELKKYNIDRKRIWNFLSKDNIFSISDILHDWEFFA
jgi:hypothetical protein